MICRFAPFLPLFPLIAAQPTAAQEELPPIRIFGGVDFIVASPTGEFAENVARGFGVDLHGRIALDRAGIASLRFDLGFLQYGRETIQVCVTQPCRVTGDLTTSNDIFLLGMGPEVAVTGGRARLYATGNVGLAHFSTSSSVSGSRDAEPYASSTNHSDVTFAWTAGGGAQIRLSRGRTPFHLNLGARYHGNGEAEYLRRGDIYEDANGNVVIDPRRSDTNFWSFRFGFSMGFPPERIFGNPGTGGDRW